MSSILSAIFTIPLVIFVVFVLPIWLWLHYRSKRQLGNGFSNMDFERLQVLTERTEKLQQRILSLERILDDESPNWRARQ